MASRSPAQRLGDQLTALASQYTLTTPPKARVLDAAVVAAVASAAMLFLYVVFVGTTFPFNAFLAALFGALGVAVLTLSLRLQLTDRTEFKRRPPQRAFADYVFCNLILFLVMWNFMG